MGIKRFVELDVNDMLLKFGILKKAANYLRRLKNLPEIIIAVDDIFQHSKIRRFVIYEE